MKIVIAFVAGVLVVFLGVVIYLATGAFDAAATAKAGFLERSLAGLAHGRSIRSRAQAVSNPVAGHPDAAREGLTHYAALCLTCHGAPGIQPSPIGRGLNPAPPPLADREVQEEWSDGALFWIASNGVRMTGMPAFRESRTEQELWQVVAFVRRLPNLSFEESAALREAAARAQPSPATPAPPSPFAPAQPSPLQPAP